MAVNKRKGKKGVSYQARWVDPSGKPKAKGFRTKAEAERYVVQMKANVARNEYSDPLAGKTKIKDVYQDWLPSTANLKPKTRASYDSLWRCLVEPAWGNRSLQSITRSEIKPWMMACTSSTGKIVSPSRMRQAYVLLKLLLDHAVDMELINRSPILEGSSAKIKNLLPKDGIKENKRVLELPELFQLAEATDEFKTMILLAGLAGLRWAEIIALTPEDFDFKSETISVNKSLTEVSGHLQMVSPKNGQGRTLPIHNILIKDLKERVLMTEPHSPVFSSREGKYLRHSNFSRRVFNPALNKLGIHDFTFHSLRHTAISQAIAMGVDIVSLSKIAGHSNPSITLNVYGHQFNNSLESFREVIDENIAKISL
jgi:integrase